MERISRYILVLVTIVTASIVLPGLYWMAFEKPINAPFVMYSCINDDFMIIRSGVFSDKKGNKYSREEYEQKLPFMNYRQLMVAETMPDTIKGVAIDMHELSRTKSFYRFKPDEMQAPKPALYPLLESESGRASLEMPDDFFRITWRMEFINAENNTILEEKSRMFSAVLYHKGFQFPARMISGLPTTRKSCDEGYFVVDASYQLYHIKMIKGNPYIHKIELPEGLKFKNIGCVDFRDKEFYAYLFSDKNEIYVIQQDTYDLVKLPVEGFVPEICELSIWGDLFNYNAIFKSEGQIKDVVLDRKFKKVDEFNETWLKKEERFEGKAFSSLFPAQLSLDDKNSSFISFYFQKSKGFNWLIVNLVLVLVHLGILRNRKAKYKKHLADLVIIAVTGIFGFIAVNFFPNKFFD